MEKKYRNKHLKRTKCKNVFKIMDAIHYSYYNIVNVNQETISNIFDDS
jgi:hypothetical protein